MAENPSSTGEVLRELRDLVRRVGEGQLDQRATVRHDEGHPLGALATGVNAMIEALGVARAEAEDHLARLEEQIQTIETQREAIRELSTPIIEVWKGVLCLPVVGVLDSVRAGEITDQLLNAIVDREASYVIIDITGIEVMDTTTTDHFMRLARSVTFLGAECVLSGVNPNVARNVVQMGVEMADVRSHRSLRDALRAYVQPTAQNGANGKATSGMTVPQ